MKQLFFVFNICIMLFLNGCTNDEGDINDLDPNDSNYIIDDTVVGPFEIKVEKVEFHDEIDFDNLELSQFYKDQYYYDINGEIISNDSIVDLLKLNLTEWGYYYVELSFKNLLNYKIDYFRAHTFLCEGSKVYKSTSCGRNVRLYKKIEGLPENVNDEHFMSFVHSFADQFKYVRDTDYVRIDDESYIWNNGSFDLTLHGITDFEPGETKTYYYLTLRQKALRDQPVSLRIASVSEYSVLISDPSFHDKYKLPTTKKDYEYYGKLVEGERLVSYKSTG